MTISTLKLPEMGLAEDTCLPARRGWYGMRDAGQAFELAVRDHFLDRDFKQGMFSTCVFAHRCKFLLYFVHGDDYVGLGVRGDLEGYKAKLSERFIIKDRGIFGADGLHEIRILNRVITYHCMRCLFLALDRPDIQFTAKEISRAMASPTIHADETLKALSRYLAGHPRVLWRYPRQEWTGKVWGLTDSNWAACPVTRKSSSATYLMLGKHPIFAARSTQTILSLSSGKRSFTELCGVLVERWG